MSLISCAIGKQLWNLRASDLEREFASVGEQLHDKMQEIRDIADDISDLDRRIDRVSDQYQRAKGYKRSIMSTAAGRVQESGMAPGGNGATPGAQYQKAIEAESASILEHLMADQRLAPIARIVANADRFKQVIYTLKVTKMKFENREDMLHAQEKALQSKKNVLDTQVKMAQAMGPAFEKMENAAIKRFTPQI